MFALTPFERKSYDLFNAFHDFENDFFNETKHNTNYARNALSFKTDIKEVGESYVMEAELPGFDKKDFSLDVNGNTLTLTAKHESENESKNESGENGNYIRRERKFGSFRRSFDVSGVDKDKIDAEYKNGILYVTMPKKQPAEENSKRIEIR